MLARTGPMSKYAFGALRTIAAEPIPADTVDLYSDTTLFPLFARHEIEVVRKNGNGYVMLTKRGKEALGTYTGATIPVRQSKVRRPVTNRTAAYLRLIRLRKTG